MLGSATAAFMAARSTRMPIAPESSGKVFGDGAGTSVVVGIWAAAHAA